MKNDRVPLLKNEDILIVPIHDELDDEETKHLETSLLERVAKGTISGVVLDVSSLKTMDLYTAKRLEHLVSMIGLMDVKTVVVGMRATVAITLTDMEVSFPDVATALSLEKGLAILRKK